MSKSSSSSDGAPCWQRARHQHGADLKACELALVEYQADALQARLDTAAAQDQALLRVFVMVRAFLVKRRRVCYGGMAINNLLPKAEQFYGTKDIPDYDVYSDTPIQDAKDMVDALRAAGVPNPEARAGVHVGTFKVYANFVAVLDVTEMPPDVFQCLQATAFPDAKDGLLYCHPMYLRIGVHVELGRPMGDVSRWTKVAERLAMLDVAYPLTDAAAVQRLEDALRAVHTHWPLPLLPPAAPSKSAAAASSSSSSFSTQEHLATAVDVLLHLGGVFNGVLACGVYQELDKQHNASASASSSDSGSGSKKPEVVIVLGASSSATPCMDVLVHDLAAAGGALAAALHCAKGARAAAAEISAAMKAAPPTSDADASQIVAGADPHGCRLVLYPPVLDLVSWRLECVAPDGRRLLAVYDTADECHAYNEVTLTRAMLSAVLGDAAAAALPSSSSRKKKTTMRVANLDAAVTLLGKIAFTPRMQRLDALATARALIALFGRHPLAQRAPWARFQLPCLGDQHGLVEMKLDKVEMRNAFKKQGIQSGAEYDRWFLKYVPGEEEEKEDRAAATKTAKPAASQRRRRKKTTAARNNTKTNRASKPRRSSSSSSSLLSGARWLLS